MNKINPARTRSPATAPPKAMPAMAPVDKPSPSPSPPGFSLPWSVTGPSVDVKMEVLIEGGMVEVNVSGVRAVDVVVIVDVEVMVVPAFSNTVVSIVLVISTTFVWGTRTTSVSITVESAVMVTTTVLVTVTTALFARFPLLTSSPAAGGGSGSAAVVSGVGMASSTMQPLVMGT